MNRMIIELDEQKIKTQGKYDINKLWEEINKPFIEKKMSIKKEGPQTIYFNPFDDLSTQEFGYAYMSLMTKKWLVEVCLKWLWIEDNNEVGDCLAVLKEEVGVI